MYTYTYIYIYVYVCMYLYMYIYMYVCIGAMHDAAQGHVILDSREREIERNRRNISRCTMEPSRRVRAVAPSTLGLDTYLRVVETWRRSKGLTLEALIGPTLAKEQRMVTATMISRLSTLIDKLIDAGCTSAVLED